MANGAREATWLTRVGPGESPARWNRAEDVCARVWRACPSVRRICPSARAARVSPGRLLDREPPPAAAKAKG